MPRELETCAAPARRRRVELDNRKPGSKGTNTLLDLRLRASGRLQRWLDGFGATPASRAAWAATLAQGGLAADIARRIREVRLFGRIPSPARKSA